jgi:hypothetical protein
MTISMIRMKTRRDQANRRQILPSGRLWTSTTTPALSIPLRTSSQLNHFRHRIFSTVLTNSGWIGVKEGNCGHWISAGLSVSHTGGGQYERSLEFPDIDHVVSVPSGTIP